MKLGLAALLLVVGCGGAPFSAEELTDSGPAVPDAEVLVDAAKTDASEGGASEGDASPEPDAGHPEDAGLDVQLPPSCAQPSTFSCTYPHGSGDSSTIVSAPTGYCVIASAASTLGGPHNTPTACQCDYSCACIALHDNPCGAGHTPSSCAVANGGLTVGCSN